MSTILKALKKAENGRAKTILQERLVAEEPFRRAAQKRLALEVTTLVHGSTATQAAIDASAALFGQGDLSVLDPGTLEAAIAESVEVVTVDYANGRADSAVLVATATWKLTQNGTGKVLASGTNSVRVPYERSSQRFATVRAARDAQVRAAKNLATIVRGQIAADLAS